MIMLTSGWGQNFALTVCVFAMLIGGTACQGAGDQSAEKPVGLVEAAAGLPVGDQWRQDFAFADMDGDGELDLVTAPPRKSKEPWPHIFLYRQNRWEAISCPGVDKNGFPQEYVYGGIAVADFDTDGKPEIVLAMHETGVRFLKNRGQGPCGPWEEQDLPKEMFNLRSRAIAAADMDRDGQMDIVALAEAPAMNNDDTPVGIGILWNEGTSWQFQNITDSQGLFGDDIAIGEVNGDDVPDIAVGSLDDTRPQFLWVSKGKREWHVASAEGLPSNIVAWSVQLVDFDGDGRDELLLGVGGAPVYNNGGPRVYRWDGTRWNDLSQGLPQVSWVCGVTAADIDGDSRKEIVAAGMYTGIVQVYRQQPDGTWVEYQQVQAVTKEEQLRNYRIRAFPSHKEDHNIIVANYAGEGSGKITAWKWQ